MEVALEGGAEDVRREGDNFEVICDPESYADLLSELEAAEIEASVKEITRLPLTIVDLDTGTGRTVLKLMEALDDHDDVQNVSANFNLPDEAMAELGEEG